MKTNKKVLAGAMAILLATGGMTNKAFAEEDKAVYEFNPPTVTGKKNQSPTFDSREEAEAAAREALKNDPINNSYTITTFAGGWWYQLKVDNNKPLPKTEETTEPDKKEEDPTVDEKDQENNETEVEENKALDGILAKVNALPELTAEEKTSFEAKLKEVSKDEQAMTDILAEAQKLNEERVEAKKQTEVEPDEKVEKDDKPVVKENNEVGFTTKEDAEKAAKEALKNDKINNSYNVSQGKDGKYYYVLSPVVEETKKKEQVKQKPVINKNAKHAAPNPKTGIVSLSSVGALLAAASTAYFGTKKRK